MPSPDNGVEPAALRSEFGSVEFVPAWNWHICVTDMSQEVSEGIEYKIDESFYSSNVRVAKLDFSLPSVCYFIIVL